MTNVTIYSTPTCGYCKLAKKYFDEIKVSYTDYDVSVDEERAHVMIHKTGQMGVPVIVIEKDGKENVMVGFNQGELAKILEEN